MFVRFLLRHAWIVEAHRNLSDAEVSVSRKLLDAVLRAADDESAVGLSLDVACHNVGKLIVGTLEPVGAINFVLALESSAGLLQRFGSAVGAKELP